jgi:signal transduction histidine kinase
MTASISPQPNPDEQLTQDQSTELQSTELQRSQLAYAMATEMGNFKAGFLARTAHELRSPLNTVISLHQLILNGLCDNPEEEQEFISQAYAAAERMLALLDQLIAVSKTEHGSDQLKLQSVNLRETLASVDYLTQLQAKNRNLRLTIELPDPSIQVKADPRWFQQVLLSLVDTPLSLMQEGTVNVTTAIAAAQVKIIIEDERPASFWHESVGLLEALKSQQLPVEEDAQTLSPGLSLLMNQTLVTLMGGTLEAIATPITSNAESSEAKTCICYTLDLAD